MTTQQMALGGALALLVACSAPEPLPAPPEPPAPILAPPPALRGQKITRQYDALRAQEPHAIIAPNATPEDVHEIDRADRAAHSAVKVLKRPGATAANAREARSAVARLKRAVAATGSAHSEASGPAPAAAH